MGKLNTANFRGLIIFLTCLAASFLIYLPVINRNFVSDDFKVLFRVCGERIIFIQDFFRPLSDLTILMNYLMGGLSPLVFNSFNILIHGINVYLVFRVSMLLGRGPGKNNPGFAFICAALFLCYPFHNEAVVWILGRGASMACLFSLLAILCYYSVKNESRKMILVCGFYFISLAAFESCIFFPVIFVQILIFEKDNKTAIRKWIVFLTATLVIHIALRYFVSGSVLGSYGGDFFHPALKMYGLNIIRVGTRLLFPPVGKVIIFISFTLVLAGLILLLILKRQKIREEKSVGLFRCLTNMLLVSCIVPVMTGLSTQTSETDRILYFPSVFLCMLLGLIIVTYIKNAAFKWTILSLVLVYFIIFLEKNNLNWKKASFITYSILNKINEKKRSGDREKIFFLNIPNEIEGAYVFRLGFPDALKLYGFDSSRYFAVNFLPGRPGENEGRIIPGKQQRRNQFAAGYCFETAGGGKLRYSGSWYSEIYRCPGGTYFLLEHKQAGRNTGRHSS